MRARRSTRVLTPSELKRLTRRLSDKAAARALRSWSLVLSGHPMRTRVGVAERLSLICSDQGIHQGMMSEWLPNFRAALLSQPSTFVKRYNPPTVSPV